MALPEAKDPKRKQLEEFFVKKDLWKEVSSLNKFAVSKLLKENQLSKEDALYVKGLFEYAESMRISVSKIKDKDSD